MNTVTNAYSATSGRILGTAAQALVARVEQARNELARLQARNPNPPFAVYPARTVWDRLLKRHPAASISQDWFDLHSAQSAAWSLEQELADLTVGAAPETWGILSGSAQFNLESTLTALTACRTTGVAAVDTELRAIRAALPQARIDMHKGDWLLAEELTYRLGKTLRSDIDGRTARKLLHHLPAIYRPIPDIDLADMSFADGFESRFLEGENPGGCGVRALCVTLEKTGELELHELTVDQHLRGLGFGSAILEHLCRIADHHSLPIKAVLAPEVVRGQSADGPRLREERAARLAHWCRRHSFTVTPRTDEYFYHHAKIRREPR